MISFLVISFSFVTGSKKPHIRIQLIGVLRISRQKCLLLGKFRVILPGRAKAKSLVWVAGDPGQVVLEVLNTLGAPLQISELRLLLEGLEETNNHSNHPTSVLLEASTRPHSLNLSCVPRSPGVLKWVFSSYFYYSYRHSKTVFPRWLLVVLEIGQEV